MSQVPLELEEAMDAEVGTNHLRSLCVFNYSLRVRLDQNTILSLTIFMIARTW